MLHHTEVAPAKINLYLAVTGRREDGYHTLLSHMQAVTLCDTLTFALAPEAGSFSLHLRSDEPTLPTDESNLICRAVAALQTALAPVGRAMTGRLDIALEKRIPMAAGLAGGSADAAAALRGCNALLGNPLTMAQLCEIGAGLGADIPFCLRCTEEGTEAMTARGIGECLTPAPALPQTVSLVIACHGEGVSTPQAYRRLDECSTGEYSDAEEAYARFVKTLEGGELAAVGRASYNCFEAVVLPEREAACELLDAMRKGGADIARMSGSGPSIVGVFKNENAAKICLESLQKQGIRAAICQPL